MIEKRRRLSISLDAGLERELRQECKKHKKTLSRVIEDVILANKEYKRELIPALKTVRGLIKQLRALRPDLLEEIREEIRK